MDILKPIADRRSIRKYKNLEVPEKDLTAILQAALQAPSAKNRQPWKFIIYRGGAKERFTDTMQRGLRRENNEKDLSILPLSRFGLPDAFHTLEIMRQAPVLIAVMNTNGGSPYDPIDTDRRVSEICDSLSIGAAIQNMLLEAESRGLGTLWIANTCFAYPELMYEIGVNAQLIGAVALGYADESPSPRPRKPLSEVVEYRD